jgi:hypothetical protein
MQSADTQTARRRLDVFLSELRERRRPVRIVPKRAHWHQRAAAGALWLLTLGGQNKYLSHYVTTLGHTIYVPDDFDQWPPDRAWQVLRHELVHVRQFERYGIVAMTLLYGLFPLPAFVAWGRAWLEWEAYRETLRAMAEIHGMEAAKAPALHDTIVARFTGPDYAYMWPFPRTVRGWIHAAVADLDHRRVGRPPDSPRS